MSEQNNSRFHKSNKPFGAPRMRATQLLDVLSDDGTDAEKLKEQLDSADYDYKYEEKIQEATRQKSNTYGALAPKPSVTGRSTYRPSSFAEQSRSVPPVGSFIADPSPVNIGVQQPRVPPVGSFIADPSPVNTGAQQPRVPPVGSFIADPSPVNTGTQQHHVPPVGSFIADPSPVNTGAQQPRVPPVGSFIADPSPVNTGAQQPRVPPVGSFIADPSSVNTGAQQPRVPPVGSFIADPSPALQNDLDFVEPEFAPGSAMAKLAALAGNASNNSAPFAAGHRRPSAGNPGMRDDFDLQAEMDFLAQDPSFNASGQDAYMAQGQGAQVVAESPKFQVGSSFFATDDEIAEIDAQMQQEIEQLTNQATRELYQNESTPYISPAQRRSMRAASQVKDVKPEELFPVNNDSRFTQASSAYASDADSSYMQAQNGFASGQNFHHEPTDGQSIINNYIPDAAPMPMPTFTPNAYTSPYEDVANITAVTHVVDADILPDDYDPASSLTNEEYMAFLASKHAEREMGYAQTSDEPIYHPWTLPKNRISKFELMERKAREKAQAELSLNPMYRLQMESRQDIGADVSYMNNPSMDSAAQTQVEVLAPPPEAHLLAQDAAMGAPVDNPLLMQSAGGKLIASIDLKGGMLAQLIYQRKSGQLLDLLYHAPWLKDNYYFRDPNLEQHMAGEWPCVPFGWATTEEEANRPIVQHGFACHGQWQLERVLHSPEEFVQFVEEPNNPPEEIDDPDSVCGVVLGFDYPEDFPLQKIVRSIYINDSDVLLNFTVYARQDCKVPMAAYPLFPMHPENDRVLLDIDGDGVVYPRQYEPGVSRFLPKSHFLSLDSIALRKDFVNKDGNGLAVDASVLPFNFQTEEVVQMLNPNGRARLYYPNKQLHVVLKWESEKLPNCVLWISNGGRQYAPWDGNNYCLGIAPMVGAWDIADDSLKPNNLIEQYGQKTYVQLKAGEPFSFSYSLFVEDLLPEENQD